MATDENPSDFGTRGKTCEELKHSSLWWSGPTWLTQDPSTWPKRNLAPVTDEQLILFKEELHIAAEQACVVMEDVPTEQADIVLLRMDLERYSSLSKLLRITAICLKFLKRKL